MSKQIKCYIEDLFVELSDEVDRIIQSSTTSDIATKQIMDCVSSKITASAKSYMATMYSTLSRETLKESVFEDDANANKFYDLNLRQKISEKYDFSIDRLDSYSKGLNFTEINRLYTSAAVAAGSTAVGGILLGVLSGMVHIPMVVIIAGAVLAGIGGSAYTYVKYVPERNKQNYIATVHTFVNSLKSEMLNWVDSVLAYYDQQVDEFKKSL